MWARLAQKVVTSDVSLNYMSSFDMTFVSWVTLSVWMQRSAKQACMCPFLYDQNEYVESKLSECFLSFLFVFWSFLSCTCYLAATATTVAGQAQ